MSVSVGVAFEWNDWLVGITFTEMSVSAGVTFEWNDWLVGITFTEMSAHILTSNSTHHMLIVI